MHTVNNNIYIGDNLLHAAPLLQKHITAPNLLIVTDAIVANLYLNTLLQTLSQYTINVVKLPSGEEHKTWTAVETILAALAQQQHDRASTIISFGGGVVGDISGFAAAIYMRGINWLQIPTTLLAQVDAAVGGKTGCNHLGIKNLIGAYYRPTAILADISLLRTLPDREYLAGLAEVVKYGFVCDADFFCWLETHAADIKNRHEQVLEYMVTQCCQIKQDIVLLDERDQKQRMILNFGHSFAHALEAATGFKYYLHGEAVALGMLLASRLAVKIGLLAQEILDRLVNLISCLGLSVEWNKAACSPSMLFDYMMHDKKKRAGVLNLVLPCALGQAVVMSEHEVPYIEDVLQSYD